MIYEVLTGNSDQVFRSKPVRSVLSIERSKEAETFCDGEPESIATLISATGGIRPVEAIEYLRHFFRRDTDSRILNVQSRVLLVSSYRGRDRPALTCVLEGVIQQNVDQPA